jgi:hypothetical protein
MGAIIAGIMIEMIMPLTKTSPETIHNNKYKETEETTEVPVIKSVAFTMPSFLNNSGIINSLQVDPDIVVGKFNQTKA